MSQPLVVAGEPEVTRLRHSQLPLSTGSGLRSREEVEESGGRKTELDASPSLCFTSWMFVRSKPANNAAVYSVGSQAASAGCRPPRPPPDGCGGPRLCLSALLSLPGWLSGEP